MRRINTMNMKKTPAMEAALLLGGKDVQIVKASIQLPILQHVRTVKLQGRGMYPKPLNMNKARRPYWSIVKNAMNEERNFQVKAPPVRILVN
jgi:hypothetical protein